MVNLEHCPEHVFEGCLWTLEQNSILGDLILLMSAVKEDSDRQY